MQYLSIDYLIVYAFLAITLVIGIRAGRGVKDIREYAIANKSFGTGALVLTLLATYLGSDAAWDDAGVVYSSGIIMAMSLLAVSGSFLLTGLFIAPKAAQFDNCLTMGDLMKEFYGRYSGMIAGVLGVVNAVLRVGLELHVLGIICESLLNIPARLGIILGGLLLAAYTVHGGIRSVVTTDILQFIILAIFIPLIAYKAIGKVGGIQELLQQVPTEKLEIFHHKDFSFYVTIFLLWIIPVGMVDPAMIQRLLMGKTGNQLRNQYLTIAAFDPVFRIMIILLGLAAIVLYPNIESDQIMPHFIHGLFPVGVQGLAIAGFLAICMASTNSYLHAAGLTLVHDIIRPTYERRNEAIDEVRWARYTTVLISVVGIYIGLNTTDTFDLYFTSLELTGPLLMFPLFAGMMGLRAGKQEFYAAFLITAIAFVSAKLALPEMYSHLAILISIAANGISFFGLHLIRNKGFVIVDRPAGEEKIWRPHQKAFFSSIQSILPTPKNITAYSQARVAQYGAPYILFGVFLLINYTIPYFIWTPTLPQYENLMIYLRMVGGVLCVLLIFREKWSPSLLPYMPTFWHFTVMYCLPFTSTLMLLLTGAGIEWVVNIFGTIILLFVLLDWLTATIVGILGISLGFAFYRFFIGPLVVSLSFSDKYLLIYQGIFGILIGLLFARRKQLRYDRLATDNRVLVASEQEIRQAHLETFIEKIRLIKTLKNADIDKLSNVVKDIRTMRNQSKTSALSANSLDKNLQDIESAVASVALALTRVDQRAMDYLRLEVKPIAIEQLLEQLQQQLPKATLHYFEKTKHQQIVCDPIQVVKVLKNTIVALPDNKDYYLTLDNTRLTYPLPTVSPQGDYVKQLPAIRLIISQQPDSLPDLADSYTPELSSASLPHPTNAQELLLTENQRIIKSHYGYTNLAVSQQASYDYYLYVIPVDVNEIRPADMDAPAMELGTELIRANDQYPGAQEQEQAFLADVRQKSVANIEKVKEALELIKWYHGAVSRRSGEPYYLHPLAVAHIVLDWNQEEATIIGGLLHDTVEDTPMLLENIEMIFGSEVAKVVDYVTHFENFKDSFYRVKLNDTENKRMLLEATDKRALYVKVADRLHNMRTIEGHKTEEKKKKIAQETLDFFVPLAKSLGLEKAAKELLEISTRVLNR